MSHWVGDRLKQNSKPGAGKALPWQDLGKRNLLWVYCKVDLPWIYKRLITYLEHETSLAQDNKPYNSKSPPSSRLGQNRVKTYSTKYQV
uniref:Uncharacterized protein n=1 Tax=Lotus japonicus TaxID=34305 RepID=I3SPB6_LOTJA|nr:unknown [Lotus japonicus]